LQLANIVAVIVCLTGVKNDCVKSEGMIVFEKPEVMIEKRGDFRLVQPIERLGPLHNDIHVDEQMGIATAEKVSPDIFDRCGR
jgi:hypothetical protein